MATGELLALAFAVGAIKVQRQLLQALMIFSLTDPLPQRYVRPLPPAGPTPSFHLKCQHTVMCTSSLKSWQGGVWTVNVWEDVRHLICSINVDMIPFCFFYKHMLQKTNLDGFHAMDQIGEDEPPGRSILTLSSPFLFRMLTTPFIMPRARYWPSFVHLQSNETLQQ